MKKETIKKHIKTAKKLSESRLTANNFSVSIGKSPQYMYNLATIVKNAYMKDKISQEDYDEFMFYYRDIESPTRDYKVKSVEDDFEGRATSEAIRDDEGRIVRYSFKVYVKNQPPFEGYLTRAEMNEIYRLYSSYGDAITIKEVSRFFPDFSLIQFKRILRAFNITKASAPFAPHMIDEMDEDQLVELNFRQKENNLLKKIEAVEPRMTKRKLEEALLENVKLKEDLKNITNVISEVVSKEPSIPELPQQVYVDVTNKNLVLHIADMHVGATKCSGAMYQENTNYDQDEIRRRFQSLLEQIMSISTRYDTIVVNLLGDQLDGMDNQTARRDHYMPQNMDNLKQISVFIEETANFILTLRQICNDLDVYSVKTGNHDGIAGYLAVSNLLLKLNLYDNTINTRQFDTFFGHYTFCDHDWVIFHGKDEAFHKRGLPLNLDDSSKIKLYDWLHSQGINSDDVHFIKGDLHSSNYNSSYRIDYRNCLSFYGSSDYSDYNFQKNKYGVSYELFIEDKLLRGEFTNL